MRVSIFTPSHDTKYIKDLYDSIKDQNFFEWVIVLNGSATLEEIDDPRVKILRFESSLVGELKYFACSSCSGDILLEVDHDDFLLPNAIEEVKKAFDSESIVFAYSNCIEYRNETWEPFTYSSVYGWKYRDFDYKGHALKEAVAFKPTPHSLAYIWYAPNHLRAFRKSVYDRIGGYNKTMAVIDDQDLMCRMYLEGDFYHIDMPLYMYRVHGENSWLKNNALIQSKTKEICDKYLYKLVEKWCERNNYLKLDVGAERGILTEGWKSIDIRPGCDYMADLNERWPFPDNSIGAVRAWDFIEHIPNKIHTMNEIHRVLIPGGWLISGTPSTDGRGAFQDPTHVSYWNENSFWYYTNREYQKYVPEITARFQKWRLETSFPTDFHKQNNIPYVIADLVAIKDGYNHQDSHVPGLIEI